MGDHAVSPASARISRVRGLRVVAVDLSQGQILDSVDDDGRDTLALGVNVLERKTKIRRQVAFRWPVVSEWDDYLTGVLGILKRITASVGDLHIPDDWKAELESGGGLAARHLKVLGGVCRLKAIREDTLDLVCNYLDPIVEPEPDVEGFDAVEWVKRNLTLADFAHVLAVVISVPTEVGRVVDPLAQALFQGPTTLSKSTTSQSANGSQPPSGSQSPQSGGFRSSVSEPLSLQLPDGKSRKPN